jgi:hypothetical protein
MNGANEPTTATLAAIDRLVEAFRAMESSFGRALHSSAGELGKVLAADNRSLAGVDVRLAPTVLVVFPSFRSYRCDDARQRSARESWGAGPRRVVAPRTRRGFNKDLHLKDLRRSKTSANARGIRVRSGQVREYYPGSVCGDPGSSASAIPGPRDCYP